MCPVLGEALGKTQRNRTQFLPLRSSWFSQGARPKAPHLVAAPEGAPWLLGSWSRIAIQVGKSSPAFSSAL